MPERYLAKIPKPLMIKTLSKLKRGGNFLNLLKIICKKNYR